MRKASIIQLINLERNKLQGDMIVEHFFNETIRYKDSKGGAP